MSLTPIRLTVTHWPAARTKTQNLGDPRAVSAFRETSVSVDVATTQTDVRLNAAPVHARSKHAPIQQRTGTHGSPLSGGARRRQGRGTVALRPWRMAVHGDYTHPT